MVDTFFHYVYGDQGGKWVTEDTIPKPKTKRGIARLKAEKQNRV